MVPAVPCTVSALVPQRAADSSSESMDLAVPGSPTRRSPRSPARVTTHRSTRARSPTNFCSITRRGGTPAPGRAPFGRLSASPALPITKVTTARGVSSQPGGRGPESWAARKASSVAYRSSGGVTWRCSRVCAVAWSGTPPVVVLSLVVLVSFVIGGGPSGLRGCPVLRRRGRRRRGPVPRRLRTARAREVGQGPGGPCHGVQAFLPGLQRQSGGAAFEPAAGEEQGAAGAGALRLHDEAGGGEFRPGLLDPCRLPLGPADAVAVRRVGQG